MKNFYIAVVMKLEVSALGSVMFSSVGDGSNCYFMFSCSKSEW